ncbi:hydantoinase/oxoprolinase family protein [Mesorhizobium sp. M2C.T.Ca.TU.002.02.1.1]|uniref:hydantoinase/oxoprolinase family protein n=1 Tax=Mesorhizobium sp. M2C.T.Ca.TU.002.02.1.1 TaxID=2496788 RepID=UPI000FCB50CB|nr:hydantoinase/oxoprolinase family protein [Mesorhizobium sp. M2C.T.Ca.TU.002.02.1.1]RUU55221.1 hydantoinase/oxoprolinase family protein [Mesorhizobium sp. M2C.T.Ca.TU.002.02.1.1]RUU70536.1 hydantoinase/oxoprolinase family protein [Mesorhizobium sp. M2C.T.Ca.TU.009.01.2.1]
MARIGVDVGGTNTDLVLECAAGVFYHKVPTTLKNQSIGVVEGVKGICGLAGIEPSEVDVIVHGTTTATNITIEHNGSETGMLTTRGFRDILHIGRHKRPYNFSLHFIVPWQSQPLVKRRNRIAISERILPPRGDVETALDENEVREATRLFKKRGINSVVIGFMFSFLNDAHERRARDIVLEEMPDAYVTLSSEVANVMREYERFSTAAMNSYVGPKTAFYLRDLESKLREAGVSSKLRIMQSNGGVSTVEACATRPVRILMSGPAGGVIGGASEGEMAGVRNIITVDIGGTSADISTIPDGRVKIMNPRDTYVSGHPVLTPMIDLVTIGAGGGSVAYIDEAGAFNVGPRSAGSEPGPACYGRGGTEPTVTDAQIVLGRLDPDLVLGGDLKLDPALSRSAIEERIAKPLGLSVTDAALGIIKIINNNMALAIRSNSVARGIDPRQFSILPFGGAGPLHGVALAEAISARDVIVPVAPGITAAVGLLKTDLQYEQTEAVIVELNAADEAQLERINRAAAVLRERVVADLDADGIARDQQRIEIVAECRYHGQGFELRAKMPEASVTQANKAVIITSFHDQHQLDYGYSYREQEVELITLRAIGRAAVKRIAIPKVRPTDGSSVDRALMFVRATTFDDGRTLETPRYDRTKLYAGDKVSGPAILVQHDSTTLVPPGYVAETLEYGNTRVHRAGVA